MYSKIELSVAGLAAGLAACLAVCTATAYAPAARAASPEPYLFADLATGPRFDANFVRFFFRQPVGGRVLFVADDGFFGSEPWATDGTVRGTHLLADLCPGRCSGLPGGVRAATPELFFFVTFDEGGTAGTKTLWATDGTSLGTRAVAHSASADAFGGTEWLPAAGRLVFENDRVGEGPEPWTSDGTPEGTRRLRDLRPGGEGSQPSRLTRLGDLVVFTADDGTHGTELWATDGTPAGTRLVADLDPGPRGSAPDDLRVVGDRLLFNAFRRDGGRALWSTDGTPAGTRLVRDLHARRSGVYRGVISDGERLFFVTDDEDAPFGEVRFHLGVSDGTPAGTRRLTAASSDLGDDLFGRPETPTLTPLGGGRVLFDWLLEGGGLEPWVTDGTPAGTGPLGDLCPGECSSRLPRIAGARHLVDDGRAYFDADDGVHGRELWVTDGTPAGTRLLFDACPGPCDGIHFGLSAEVTSRGLLLEAGPEGDRALWLLQDAGPPLRLVGGDADLSGAVELPGSDDVLLGLAADGRRTELWRSDLTADGTVRLRGADREVGSHPRRLTEAADRLVLVTQPVPGGPARLWASDGTPAGTAPIGGAPADVEAALAADRAELFGTSRHLFVLAEHESSDATYVAAWEAGSGTWAELPLVDQRQFGWKALPAGDHLVILSDVAWVSDGTAAGTRRLDGVEPDRLGPAAVLGDSVVFSGESTQNLLLHLWRADGDGLVALRALGETSSGRVDDLVEVGGEARFVFDGRLWGSDGTPAGTRPLFALPFDQGVEALYATLERLFLVSERERGAPGRLWTTDGTAEGTVELDLFVDRVVPLEESLLIRGSRVGPENAWWISDGTPEGTVPLQGLEDRTLFGPSIYPLGSHFVAVEALDEVRPFAVTLGDGTAGGLERIAVFENRPDAFFRFGDTVFFVVDDGRQGEELWAFHLDGSPPLVAPERCAADAETLCLLDGRFRVRARWRDPRTGREGTAGARPFPGSDRTGVFWFFHPDNVELIVKQLDGRGLNGFFWTFWGALSDVEYWIEVADLETGAARTYRNPPFEICGRGDTAAFPGVARAAGAARAGAAVCTGPGRLCLQGGRFAVDVAWRDPRTGATGVGTPIAGTDRTGYFWFFRDDNVELAVKVLDGRPVNGRFWVFFGALTDVEYTLTVTDTDTGDVATYHNPPGEICGGADTAAFGGGA